MIEKEPESVCDDIESNGKADATKESELSDIFKRRENAALKRRYEIKVCSRNDTCILVLRKMYYKLT